MLFWLMIFMFFGVVNLLSSSKHLILMIMGLEFLMICILFQISNEVSFSSLNSSFVVLLVMMVSEGCFSMSLFVYYCRVSTSDQFNLVFMSKL